MTKKIRVLFFCALTFTSVTNAQWIAQAPMAVARGQHGAVAHPNGNIYVWGGFTGSGTPFTSLEIYNHASNSWSVGAPIPQPTRGMAFALGQDNMIYSFGGFDLSWLSFVYKYDVVNDVWSLMAPMPVASWECTAATGPNGNIYVFAGENTMNLLQIYNPVSNTWSNGAPVPVAVRMHSAVTAPNGKIYVIGGYNGATAITNNQIYDPALNSWSTGAPLPTARNQFGSVLGPDGKIYIIGGKNSGTNNVGPFFNTVDVYDPNTDTWSTGTALPATIGETEAAVVNGGIHLIGGTTGLYLTSNYRMEIAACATLAVTTSPSTSICIGQNASLTANATGGNPGYSYLWSNGSSLPSINVSPAVTTTYYVTVTDSVNCTVVSQPIVVSVSPPITLSATSNIAICSGGSTQISAQATGGDGNFTYTWTPNIGSGPGPHTVSPGSTTIYIVTVTDGCGTPASPDTVVVTVNPRPDIAFTGTNLTGCTPVTTCFTDQSTVITGSITQWLWNFGDATTSTSQNPCHTYNTPGQYSVTLTATTNAGCSQSFTFTNYVDAHPISNAAFNYTAIGLTVYFFDNSTSAASWNWNFGDSNTSNAVDPIHSYTSAGQYMVCLTAPNIYGCSDTACSLVNVIDVGMPENNVEEITIYPNPVANQFTIYDLRFAVLGVEVYDAHGRRILSTLKPSNQPQVAIEASEWKSGVYIVKILDVNKAYRALKLIKL